MNSLCSAVGLTLVVALTGCAAKTRAVAGGERTAAEDDRAQIDRQALRQLISGLQTNPSMDALNRVEGMIKLPAFSQLPSGERYAALLGAGFAAYKLKEYSRAVALLVRSSAMPEARVHDWYWRMQASWAAGDRRDAIRSLTVIARRWPEELADISEHNVLSIASEARKLPLDSDDRFQLLEALFKAQWKPARIIAPSWLWRDLALILIERDIHRAAEVAREVTNPYSLIAMKADNRFGLLVRAMPNRFDVEWAAAMELAQLQSATQKSPRSLALVTSLARLLRKSLKYQESLDLVDAALGQLKAEKPPYDDVADELPWVMNARSEALQGLGRWDEAVEELERASRQPEHGHPNVSQVINLAYLYCYLDRPKEALPLVERVAEASGYGWTQVWRVRVMAAIEMQDAAELERCLDYLRQHKNDSIESLQGALVQANRIDEAASLLISRLADPNQRSDALVELQNYAKGAATPRLMKWRDQWEALTRRSDVQAAIAAVGRIERFGIASE